MFAQSRYVCIFAESIRQTTRIHTMKNLTILENELKIAKENISIAKSYMLLTEAFERKNDYTFDSLCGDPIGIFGGSEIMWSCGRLDFHNSTISHFLEMFEIANDKDHPCKAELKKLEKAIKVIRKQSEIRDGRLFDIIQKMKL
jgi:hypothetical protein